MANRNTKVTLTAQVSQYIEGMRKASEETSKVGSEAEKLAAKKEAFNQLGQAALAVGALAAAGVALAITKFADFDQAMSNVAAATHESADNMSLLREAALDAGARTVFSATEAANAIEELGKAGVSTQDILNGGLDGALDLAAAGGLGVAEAAGIAATALTQFSLKGTDMSHVADLLAAGAGKAMGDVSDFSQALNQAGLVASQTGLSIEETTGGLAAFASAGLLGSDAGTSFKSMLQRLTPQSAEAKAKMDELGISAYDAQGNFIGLESFAGNLQESLSGLTVEQRNSALATIFGSDAVRAASVLYKEGAEGIEEWTEKVDDQGYAAETAATRLDNLKGDVEALGGAFDTALIQTGSAANDAMRGMVQLLTNLVDRYNSLPEPMKAVTLTIGGLVAVVGLAGGAFLLAIPKIAAFNAAVATMGGGVAKTAGAMKGFGKFLIGPWGLMLATAGIALAALDQEIQKGVPSLESLTNALETSSDAADLLAAATKRGSTETTLWGDYGDSLKDLPGLLDKATNAGVRWLELSFNEQGALDSLDRMGDAFGDLASKDLPAAKDAFVSFAEQQGLTKKETQQLLDEMPGFKSALTAVATEMGLTAKDSTLLGLAMGDIVQPTQDNSAALAELEGGATDAEGSISDLADTIRGFGSAELDVRSATRDVEAAFDDLTGSIEDNGSTLDVTTEKGRANESAIDDMATSALELAAATYEQTGSMGKANDVISTQRERLMKTLQAMGMTKDEAGAYADKLGLIPDNVNTAVAVSGVDEAERRITYLTRDRTVRVTTYADNSSVVDFGQGKNKAMTYANGGMVVHPNAIGNMYDSGIYSGTQPLYKFAEPETGWEAFISGKQGQEQRNIGIAYEALARLGALPQPQVVMSTPATASPDLSGMAITGRLEIGGDGLARIIDGRLERASTSAVQMRSELGR